eukprot:m.62062 g.62062  ORF g.62062 m.62062 type:complete len:192 (+) comp16240_c1_seq1:3-578(+)
MATEATRTGTTWHVQNAAEGATIVVPVANMKQTVVITDCIHPCRVHVTGVASHVVVDKCSRLQLRCDHVLSLRLLNSSRIECQATSHLGSVDADQVDNATFYVPRRFVLEQQPCPFELLSSRSLGLRVCLVDNHNEEVRGAAGHFTVPTRIRTTFGLSTSAAATAATTVEQEAMDSPESAPACIQLQHALV